MLVLNVCLPTFQLWSPCTAKVLSDEIYERICRSLRLLVLDLEDDAHWTSIGVFGLRLRWPRTRILCHIEGPCWICLRVSVCNMLQPMLRHEFSVQMPEKDGHVEKHTKTMMTLKPRVEDMWSRTLTINGFSKAFSMTGHLSCTDTLWSILSFK